MKNEIFKEYDYVAIGGIAIKEIKQSDYKFFKPLLDIYYKINASPRLGFTNMKGLKNINSILLMVQVGQVVADLDNYIF